MNRSASDSLLLQQYEVLYIYFQVLSTSQNKAAYKAVPKAEMIYIYQGRIFMTVMNRFNFPLQLLWNKIK